MITKEPDAKTKEQSYTVDENGNKIIELSDLSAEQKKRPSFNVEDVCFLNVILTSIKDNLEYLAFLKEELENMNSVMKELKLD